MLIMHKVFLKILFLIPVIGYANDPFEEINREVWTFNEGVDNRIARPVAELYDGVVPVPIQSSITNFFSNLDEIDNSINQILQGKPIAAANDLGRFIINASFGILGFFDVASIIGFEEHDEDFGQTLGVWGVPSGWYTPNS